MTRPRKTSPIYVTRPQLPPLEELIPYLENIWDSKILTNSGPFHKQLELSLRDYLGVKHLSLCTNGTLGLVIALKALGIKGEVITTPYSFVGTAHSLLWNGIRPVFVDIDPVTLNLNPDKIEAAVTSQTSAIMPVHCYGQPCDVERIQKVADKHGLKVIYDAAHAFGVRGSGGSILHFGDLSVLSFHATKVYNTFEGGAIVSQTAEMKEKIDDLKNFGFHDEVTVEGIGLNGKMSEVHAAVGLLQLQYIDIAIEKRKRIAELYQRELNDVCGLRFLDQLDSIQYNHAYFPVFINEQLYGKPRDEVYGELKKHGIYCRRYFYPLITHFSAYKDHLPTEEHSMPVAEQTSNEVICLPIYPDLEHRNVETIVNLLKTM